MDLAALLRVSARNLLRRPGYTALVVATLAVGVGGTTAVFSLVNGVLLESIPFEDTGRLVTLNTTSKSSGFGISLSIPNYHDWLERNRSFSAFGASAGWNYVRETADGAEQLEARAVLGDFFGVLGVRAAHGRLFEPEETEAGAAPTVVLGHAFWERAFEGDPGAVGSSVVLDEVPYTILGVLPEGVGYPSADVDVYTAMGAQSGSLPWTNRSSSFGTRAYARLAPGVTLATAQEDMDRVNREIDELEGLPQVSAEVVTLEDLLLGDVKEGLWILLGAVALLLLIAGANVANLALARGEGRSDELAVRRALGAGRTDVLRLLLAESLWLSLAGGALGVVLAWAAVAAFPRFLPLDLPALVEGQVAVHAPVLAFALLVSVGAGTLFGLVPALRATRVGALREGTRAIGGRAGEGFRGVLVVAQVALSVVLLVGAGLLLRSLGELSRVDKGFDETDVLTARLAAPRSAHASVDTWLDFHDRVLERLEGSPEVVSAATTILLPYSGSWERTVRSEAGPEDAQDRPSFLFNMVSEAYFDVMDVPLLRGRTFERSDDMESPLVTVIDERMAERFFPGQDPIGQRLSFEARQVGDATEAVYRTVVGVVANMRHYTLEEPSRIQAYTPMRQGRNDMGTGLRVVARLRGDPATVTTLLRQTVASLNPAIPVAEVRMLEAIVAEELGTSRALGAMTAVFGGVAALLAALGIFGVLSLAVARRSREIGVRMAVGATRRAVVRLVAVQGVALVGVGAGIGLVVAAVSGKLLEAFLYQVQPIDPLVFAAATMILIVVAAVAVTQPALRAAGTAPSQVLRD